MLSAIEAADRIRNGEMSVEAIEAWLTWDMRCHGSSMIERVAEWLLAELKKELDRRESA